MKKKIFCKNCNKLLNDSQRFCDNCGTENIYHNENDRYMEEEEFQNSISTKKKLIRNFICLLTGVLVFGVIYISISSGNSNSKTSNTASSENKSEADTEKTIFDVKKLIGAKKQEVDTLLNITGTQDENEPYTYHYGDNIDVTFGDDGSCLALCLDTKGNGYQVADENKILKSYGIDVTNSNSKQSSEFLKSYTQINGFGEVEVFYNNKKNESSDSISQIVFYTDSSKKTNDFLEKKSEELETQSNSNSQNTNNNTGTQKHFNYTMDSNKYNEFLTRLNTIEKNDSERNNKANTTYDITMYSNDFNKQYDTLLNDIYSYLKGDMPKDEFKKLQDEEIKWINEKETAIKNNVQDHQGGSMNAYTSSLTSLDYTHKRICELLEEVK